MTIEAIFTHFPSIETEHPILRQILSIAGESWLIPRFGEPLGKIIVLSSNSATC